MSIKYEGKMFEPVKNYLKKLANCSESIESFGYDSHGGVPNNTGWVLNIDDYCANPDVYGIGREKIYLCQGKFIKKSKGKLWEVIGQGISNRNYCNYLYIFFEKEYLEKIKKDKLYYHDFEAILKHFNIGLLVINSDFQVEEVIQAKEQNAPKKNINLTKKKISNAISSEATIKKPLRTYFNSKKIEPFKILTTYMESGRPAFYIYLDKWQKEKELKYFIKFYKERVLIGISVSRKLMQGGIKNKILNNTRFTFTEYNGNKIDANLNYKKEESKKTHEFHVSIPIIQKFEDFISYLNSIKGKEVISQALKKLSEVIERMNPILKTLV